MFHVLLLYTHNSVTLLPEIKFLDSEVMKIVVITTVVITTVL